MSAQFQEAMAVPVLFAGLEPARPAGVNVRPGCIWLTLFITLHNRGTIMRIQRFPLILSVCLAGVLAGAAHAEVPGIKDGAQMTSVIAAKVPNISTRELQHEIESNPELVLIDIRMPDEIRGMGGAIKAPQNVNIPRGWLEFQITSRTPSKDTPIVVYCGANIRSPLAAYTLQQMGYTNVKNYPDGFIGWKRQGLPVQ
jgi:rhodanese-related sulfurtransferase